MIQSSFLTQYGLRLSKDLKGMKWREFRALLSGLNGDTPLGTIVSIRSENDREIIKSFTPEQKRIRNEWRKRQVDKMTKQEQMNAIEDIQKALAGMLGVQK